MPLGEYLRPRNVRSYFRVTLDKARRGSLIELEALCASIDTLPVEILPEVLDICIYHMDKRKIINEKPGERASHPSMLARESLKTIQQIAAADDFKVNPCLAKKIVDMWSTDVEFIIHLLKKVKELGDKLEFDEITNNVVQVLVLLVTVDSDGMIRVLKYRRCQTLICYFWLHSTIHIDLISSLVTATFSQVLDENKPDISVLLKAMETLPTKQTIPYIAVARLDYNLRQKVEESSWNALGAGINTITHLMREENGNEELAKGLARRHTVSSVLATVQLCLKHTMTFRGRPQMLVFQTASQCIVLLHRCFSIRQDLIRRALRCGLIQTIIDLGEWETELGLMQKPFINSVNRIIMDHLIHQMKYPRAMSLMVRSARELPPDYRRLLEESNSKLIIRYSCFEFILGERFLIYRMHMFIRKIACCDTCKKPGLRRSMKHCGNCRKTTYCSKACQIQGWFERGHKSACAKMKISRIGTHLGSRESDLLEYFVIADIGRYLNRVHEVYMEKGGFDRKENILMIDYCNSGIEWQKEEWSRLFNLEADDLDEDEEEAERFLEGLGEFRECIEDEMEEPEGKILVASAHARNFVMLTTNLTPTFDFPEGRVNNLSRYSATVDNSEDLLGKEKVKPDLIDYLLSFCGTTMNDFWKADLDAIVEKVFLDEGPIGVAARETWLKRRTTFRFVLSQSQYESDFE